MRAIKIITIIGIVMILNFAGLLAYSVAVSKRAVQDARYQFTISENSMCPFGFCDGEKAWVYYNKPCNIGDICSFKCLSDRCDEYKGKYLIKYLADVSGNRVWVVGRSDQYKCSEGDGCMSFDSPNFFGWMEEGVDVSIEGPISK